MNADKGTPTGVPYPVILPLLPVGLLPTTARYIGITSAFGRHDVILTTNLATLRSPRSARRLVVWHAPAAPAPAARARQPIPAALEPIPQRCTARLEPEPEPYPESTYRHALNEDTAQRYRADGHLVDAHRHYVTWRA